MCPTVQINRLLKKQVPSLSLSVTLSGHYSDIVIIQFYGSLSSINSASRTGYFSQGGVSDALISLCEQCSIANEPSMSEAALCGGIHIIRFTGFPFTAAEVAIFTALSIIR